MTMHTGHPQLRPEALIVDLYNISPDEVEKLHSVGIQTHADLWERVGQDPNRGLSIVAGDCAVPEDRLEELLLWLAVQEVNRPQGSWLSRNWLELSLVSLVVVVALLIARAGLAAGIAALLPLFERRAVMVVAAHDLPAYHLLSEDDLHSASGVEHPAGFNTVGDVAGRFTLTELVSGTVLLSEQLSIPAGLSSGWIVLAVPVAQDASGIAVPGLCGSLLLVPRDSLQQTPPWPLRVDVIVLATSEAGKEPSLVVAVKHEDLDRLSQSLGVSEVYLVMSASQLAR